MKGEIEISLYTRKFQNCFFDNKITFENSQLVNTNSKGNFVLKNQFDTLF